MPDASFREVSRLILDEAGAVLGQVKEEEVQAFEDAILEAGAVFLAGEGRSGLVGRCFATRLMHLGLCSHVVGEMVTPAIQSSDLLIAVSGSGETPTTCTLARSAAQQGARVAAVTAARASPLSRSSHLTLLVPGAAKRGGALASQQHGGSLFEQAALLTLDAIAFRLQRRLGRTSQEMEARHATLE